jgi:hypothetical protein
LQILTGKAVKETLPDGMTADSMRRSPYGCLGLC